MLEYVPGRLTPAIPDETTVPTLWIAGVAAVAVLGATAWMLLRGRAARVAASAPLARDAAASGRARDGAMPRRAEAAATGADSVPATAVPEPEPELEPEAAILLRLCARACAGQPASPEGAPAETRADIEAAAVEVLARIDAHPRYTPRRPQLLPQLTRAINDPTASAQSITAILAQDPALAGNLLRIANSALYRRHAVPIEHLERAVTLLGSDGLRQIVMAALLQPVIADDGSALARCAALLWEHTLLSASLAPRAAPGATRDEVHATQLLALLYGLGSVVVVQVLRDTWSRGAAGDPDPQLLVSLLGTWSVRCARSISADWGLSARVQRALDELAADAGAGAQGELGRSLRKARAAAATDVLGAAGPEPAAA